MTDGSLLGTDLSSLQALLPLSGYEMRGEEKVS